MSELKSAVILGFVKKQNEALLINCIMCLKTQTYKNFEIHIYDNSCLENSLAEVKRMFPDVKIQKNDKNLGFAGGNNSVLRPLLKTGEYKYLILLNDDTGPQPRWLESLIEAAETDSRVGAVTSKLIYYEDFVRIKVLTDTVNLKEKNISDDSRNLGVKLYEKSTFENSTYNRKFFREGLYGYEQDGNERFSWSDSEFEFDLPIGYKEMNSDYNLQLVIGKNTNIESQNITIELGDFKKSIKLNEGIEKYEILVPKDIILKTKFSLIQNASTGLTGQFDGYDIGNLNNQAEIDHGQYDTRKEAVMICGGAVLFKVEALKDVGIFDEYFFVYYEDSDLSLRLKRKGWKLLYEPNAVVRHIHNASSTEYSPLFTYHVWKNKPAFVLKNMNIRPNIYMFYLISKELYRSFKWSAQRKFKDPYWNMRLKVQLKSFLKFKINIPIILLKRFYIIRSD